jgi:hypothetical protein
MTRKWWGRCSQCGAPGDASNLFCYSAATGELQVETYENGDVKRVWADPQYQFCLASKTDCLARWVAARSPQQAPAPASQLRRT